MLNAQHGVAHEGGGGNYRLRRLGGLGSDARVTDGATEMDVPESVYRVRGYPARFRQAALEGQV
jgi:hypothetical protein